MPRGAWSAVFVRSFGRVWKPTRDQEELELEAQIAERVVEANDDSFKDNVDNTRHERKGKFPEKLKSHKQSPAALKRFLENRDKKKEIDARTAAYDTDFDEKLASDIEEDEMIAAELSRSGGALLEERRSRFRVTSRALVDDLSDSELEIGKKFVVPESLLANRHGKPLSDRVRRLPNVYTPVSKVADHEIEDVGKFYQIPEETLAEMPEFFKMRRGFHAEQTRASSNYMMIRPQGHAIVKEMKLVEDEKHPGSVIGVSGPRGTGKSCVLHYATQYALQNGWLVVGTDGEDFPQDLLGLITPRKEITVEGSGRKLMVYNQGPFVKAFLQDLAGKQSEALRRIALKGNKLWDWAPLIMADAKADVVAAAAAAEADAAAAAAAPQKTKKEAEAKADESEDTDDVNIDFDYVDEDDQAAVTGEVRKESPEQRKKRLLAQLEGVPPKTLLDLCNLAATDPNQRDDILYEFVQQLQVATEVPVLVVVDSINRWDHPSDFVDPLSPKKNLVSRQLATVDAFSVFESQAPKYGVSLFALSTNATMKLGRRYLERAHKTVTVPVYTNEEMVTSLTHYKEQKVIASVLSPWFYARMKGFTGGVPRDLLDAASLS